MIERVARIVQCGLWLMMATLTATLQAELKPEKIYRKVLPSVMTLEVENTEGERFIGSAVLALGDDVAITAWHVIADARKVWAVFSDGQRVNVSGWIDHDSRRDLALVRLDRKFPHRQATVSRKLEPVAARAYVIGAPKGYGFSISDGLISQLRAVDGVEQYQISCPISPGNSGGPVLNDNGEVIGIASWTKADAQNVSFAVPTRELTKLNAAGQSKPWAQIGGQKLDPPQRATKADAARTRENASTMAMEELQRQLQKSAGRTVTVVVQEDGGEQRFTFTVPAGSPK